MRKLIILNQKIIDWEVKGEIKQNYFNTNNKFKFITIISFAKGKNPKISTLKKLCGHENFEYFTFNSKLLINNYIKYFLPKYFYRKIINNELKTLKIPKPNVIRCIGDGFIGYISGQFALYFKSKVYMSIHTFISLSIFINYLTFKEKIIFLANSRFKKESHNTAHKIFIPYSKIKNSITNTNQKKIQLVYNFVKDNRILKKEKTSLAKVKTTNFVFVGRLIKGKSIIKIVNALAEYENISLTIYGDGPERNKIERLSSFKKNKEKIKIIGFYDNSKLLDELNQFDVFIAYHKFYEFPKTIIEAIRSGLPIILNRQPSEELDEFKQLDIIWTDGTVESYKKQIKKLINRQYNTKVMTRNNYLVLTKLLGNGEDYDD